MSDNIIYIMWQRIKEKFTEGRINMKEFRPRIGIYYINTNEISSERQCGPVVRALALRSGDPGFKTRSDHSLNLFLVVPGSTSQLHL